MNVLYEREPSGVFPGGSETEAQHAFLRHGFRSAQLRPGLFKHIGEGCSLRLS